MMKKNNNNNYHNQNYSFGRPIKDIGVNYVNTTNLCTNGLTSYNHMDPNIINIEQDISDLQYIAYQQTEESINNFQEISTVQNNLMDLQFTQSLPWFCKSNFVYGKITENDWNDKTIPDSSNQLFIRYIDLSDTYTGMFLFFPRVENVGAVRHVAMHSNQAEACIFITTNPEETVRLNSFEVEWFPGDNQNNENNEDSADNFVGFGTLLARPSKLGGYVFGSSGESKTPGSTSIIFPGSGAFYSKSIYIDNNSGHSKIVLIGQKFQTTNQKNLGSFSYYGVQ